MLLAKLWPQLTVSCVATQFFSVLCSVFYNKSYLRSGQWSGVVLVFVGLGKRAARHWRRDVLVLTSVLTTSLMCRLANRGKAFVSRPTDARARVP